MQVGLEMIKIQCFCSSQHSWWLLLWSVRGAQCWGCLLLTPPQDSEGSWPQLLWWLALVVTPLVCKGSLALGLPAGDSCSGFQGDSASASVVVSMVGDSSSGLWGESGVRVACWWLLLRVPRGVSLSCCSSWHSWFLKSIQHAKLKKKILKKNQ